MIPAYSTDEKDIVKQINQFNQLETKSKECQHCLHFSGQNSQTESAPDQENPLLQQCALDICGAPTTSNNIYLFNNLFDKHKNLDRWDQQFSEQVEPAIRNAILEELKRRWNIADALRANLHDPKSGLQSTNAQTLNQIASLVFKDYVDFKMIHSPESITITAKINLPENASDVFKKGVDSFAKQKKREIENSVHQTLFYTPNFMENAPPIFVDRWKAFISKYEEEKSRNPSFMKSASEQMNQLREEVKKIKENPLSVFELSKQLDQLLMEFRVATNQQERPSSASLCHEETCQQALRENILNQYKQYEDGIDIDKILSHCRTQFTIANLVPKTDGLKSRSLDIKKQLLKKISAKYSSESRGTLKKKINNDLQIDFSNEINFTDQIESFLNETRNKSHVPIPDNSFVHKGTSHHIGAPLSFLSEELLSPEFNPSSICNYSAKSGSTFKIDEPKPKIVMSVFDCTFHEHGKQSLAHELGHALSYFFFKYQSQLSEDSYEEYKNLRRCATERYTVNNKDILKGMLFHHEGDKLRTEEDMADLIAYKVFSNDPLLHQCSLLTPLKDGSQYKSPRILQKPIKHIFSYESSEEVLYRDDTHSAPLLRVITEAIHKRIELPPTCQQVVDIYSEKGINFEPCF